jgi:geranylgeranyl diphosphate synthase, type I
MDIEKTIKHYKQLVDSRLRVFLTRRLERASHVSPTAVEMMHHILEFNLRGGKRIRPILVLFGYKSFGGKDEKAIIDAAIAVELMEAFLLIHDDIMDQDTLRRGYLTMHKIYENRCQKRYPRADAKRYGECMALIAGDIISIMGIEAILASSFPVKNKLAAIDTFNRAVINTCFGQVLDLHSEIEEKVTESDISRVHELKTAIYTFEGPLHMGALLAGAKERDLALLSRYAIPLGKAFQLQDDILGLFGTQQKIGKPVGSDIREGKQTLLIIKALERAGPIEQAYIAKCLGNQRISTRDITRIQDIVTRTGSLEYSRKMIQRFIGDAKEVIVDSRLTREGKEFLFGLAEYLEKRQH